MILITGLIDFLVYLFSTMYLTFTAAGVSMSAETITTEAQKTIDEVIPVAEKVVGSWRFGEHYPMILLIPVILLFSYTRRHKNDQVDLYIPIGGVILAFLVGIEGAYQAIVLNLPILMQKILDMATQILK